MTHQHREPPAPVPPQMRMAALMCRVIMSTNGAMPPETGGILLGPISSDDITDFYLDHTAVCTGGTYAPDHITLNRLMKTLWLPAGLDMKGFVHSHPPGMDRLSHGDLDYIARLFKANDDMTIFAAPIVMPDEYRICPFIVHRDRPRIAQRADLILF